jgi:hypothetical protein
MNDLNLRVVVAALTQSDPKLFTHVQTHAQQVLKELCVSVWDSRKNLLHVHFPGRREHVLLMLDWFEFDAHISTTAPLHETCVLVSKMQGDNGKMAQAMFLALVLPAVLLLSMRTFSGTAVPVSSCTSSFLRVETSSSSVEMGGMATSVGESVWRQRSLFVLQDIASRKLPALPTSFLPSSQPFSSSEEWWMRVTWADVCEALQIFSAKHEMAETSNLMHFSDLSQDDKDFVSMQLRTLDPRVAKEVTVRLPRTEHGQTLREESLRILRLFRPWAGPYTADKLHLSLWQNTSTRDICTYEDMMKFAWGDVPSLLGGAHFHNVLLAVDDSGASSLSAGFNDDAIVNVMVGDASSLPKTFSIVPDQRMFVDWEQGSTLASISHSGSTVTSEQVRGILLQVTWTLAVLQHQFPGFQHNNLASSIRLVRFGKTRCFRVVGTGGGFAFCIPKSVPLPIITQFSTANVSNNIHGKLPSRMADGFDRGADLQNVLDVMTQNTFGVHAFEGAVDLQKACSEFCDPSRLVFESSLEKSQPRVAGDPNSSLQQMLFNDVFDEFLSKGGPSSSAVAQVDTF